uniref:Uncharacterized protein n=1 Tax=Timema genevievae TaxID=629358 RepID=A0A7R9PM65_TIMGE|nr:unnamed protein product [Timema genevievae]
MGGCGLSLGTRFRMTSGIGDTACGWDDVYLSRGATTGCRGSWYDVCLLMISSTEGTGFDRITLNSSASSSFGRGLAASPGTFTRSVRLTSREYRRRDSPGTGRPSGMTLTTMGPMMYLLCPGDRNCSTVEDASSWEPRLLEPLPALGPEHTTTDLIYTNCPIMYCNKNTPTSYKKRTHQLQMRSCSPAAPGCLLVSCKSLSSWTPRLQADTHSY